MLITESRSNGLGFLGFSVAVFVLLSSGSDARAGTVTRFTVVDSSPTSWVARGYNDYTVTPDLGWTFSARRNFDDGVSIRLDGSPLAGTSVDYWNLDFAAPFEEVITPGFYPDFQRFPFQDADRPGLSFSSTGRLDNRASGFYEVFEATYGPTGEVLSFAADFTHYGEQDPNNWAIVEVRFNAIPEPSTVILALVGLPLLHRRRRKPVDASLDNCGHGRTRV